MQYLELSKEEFSACLTSNIVPASLAAWIPQTSNLTISTSFTEQSLLNDYLKYTLKTESPTAYHLFSCLTIFGACLRRQVWIDRGAYTIYPNLATILIGPAGRVRKSTAAGLALKLLETVERSVVIQDKITQESLHSKLAEYNPCCALLYASELSTFLSNIDYNAGLITYLTRLLDSPDTLTASTLKRGTETLRNVAVSILACSNEEWIARLPEDSFGGGFWSRILAVRQTNPAGRYSDPPPLDANLHTEIVRQLLKTQFIQGAITLASTARLEYSAIYDIIMDSPPKSQRLRPFYSRAGDHTLRLAMLLQLAESPQSSVIEAHNLRMGYDLVKFILNSLSGVYAYVDLSRVGRVNYDIRGVVRANGNVSSYRQIRTELQSYSKSEIDGGLNALLEMGLFVQSAGAAGDGKAIYYNLESPEEII